jgi:hypothetical protein
MAISHLIIVLFIYECHVQNMCIIKKRFSKKNKTFLLIEIHEKYSLIHPYTHFSRSIAVANRDKQRSRQSHTDPLRVLTANNG